MTQKERERVTALDSAYRDGCDDRANKRAASVWPWDDHLDLTTAYMDGYNGRDTAHHAQYGRPCAKCGRVTLSSGDPFCVPCEAAARQPQGEPMRLFTPAPTQIAGQLTL